MPGPNWQMRQVRHPLWRAVAIFMLLLVSQLSYAGELCRSVTGRVAAAHTAPAGGPEAMSSARVDCRSDPACAEAASDAAACVASRYEPALSAVALTTGFEPAILTGAIGAQWMPSVQNASAAFRNVAAVPHPSLRNLYCRYLV